MECLDLLPISSVSPNLPIHASASLSSNKNELLIALCRKTQNSQLSQNKKDLSLLAGHFLPRQFGFYSAKALPSLLRKKYGKSRLFQLPFMKQGNPNLGENTFEASQSPTPQRML